MASMTASAASLVQMLGFALLVLHTQASVTVHYFAQASCNANTALSSYSDPQPVASESACIPAPPETAALYVDGVDDGCTVRTYTDASCGTVLGLSITVGTCYYQDAADATIGSWRAVCGAGADDAGSSDSTNTVVTMSLMSSATVGSDIAPSVSTDDPTITSSTDVDAIVTSVETVTPTMTQSAPPTGGNNGSNGTDATWNMSQPRLNPTGSPGLQGTGVGFDVSGAGGSEEWRKNAMKALAVMGVLEWLF